MTWLGNKNDPTPAPQQPRSTTTNTTPSSTPSTPSAPASYASPTPREYEPAMTSSKSATIGKSIHIKGELTGSEDLAIEGRVDGKITLSGCRVTIGTSGQVTADIVAKTVVVAGQVKGSIRAEERVEVAATGNLLGDVRSPRVVLVDGAKFKGAVDMEPTGASSSASSSKSASSSSSSSSSSAPSVKHDPLLVPEASAV